MVANSQALPQTKSKKHFRSASCDVKMIRSFAKDHNSNPAMDVCETSKFKNLKKLHTHSRNNSSDLNSEFRHKLVAHSNSCSRDDTNFSIRYIQNQLKPQEDEEDEDELTTGCGHFVRKHSRNHSYDQIYMPNNIRFDPEFFRSHNNHHHHHANNLHHSNNKKNVNLLKNVVESKLKNSNETNEPGSRGHSRNNSKDLNIKVSQTNPNTNTNTVPTTTTLTTETALSILRHRRTNSKDLNHTTTATTSGSTDHPIASTAAAVAAAAAVSINTANKKHSRSSSHQKIQIDDDRSGLIDNDNNKNDDDDESEIELVPNQHEIVNI